MAWFARTKELRKKIEGMENALKESFSRVKEDMAASHAWITYFSQKTEYLESQLSTAQSTANAVKKQSTGISEELDDHKKTLKELLSQQEKFSDSLLHLSLPRNLLSKEELNFYIENISKELFKLDKKIEDLSYLKPTIESMKDRLQEHMVHPHTTTHLEKKVEEIQEKLKQFSIKVSPKEKLVQKVTKSSHDYLKALVISYIKKYEKISAFQLREMVVEEQNLTSKSTFYRILEEIEELGEISILWEGKEKVYLSKLRKPV